MTRFLGCLVVMSKDAHAGLVAACVAERAASLDQQVRAMTAETEVGRLRADNRRLMTVVAALASINAELRDTVRMDEVLLGFGEGA